MNKKAQELSMAGAVGGILGGFAGFIMAKAMNPGIFMVLISTAVTAVVCYFIVAKILDN